MDFAFNGNLRRIRKEKGFTQEQLAEAVGVSPQAVSKWEAYSFPDAALLPVIADFLGVSIDHLFGRELHTDVSMNQQVVDYFRNMEGSEMFPKLFELCRAAMLGCMYIEDYVPLGAQMLSTEERESHSQLTTEDGWLQSRNNENLQYFLLMPQPQGGYDGVLAYDEDLRRLFAFLGLPDALRAMYYLAGQQSSMFFTAKALSAELGISDERAEQIVSAMTQLRLIWAADLNCGSEKNEKVYQYRGDCHFVSFITFARTLLHHPSSFNYLSNSRTTPYFVNDTYREDLPSPE